MILLEIKYGYESGEVMHEPCTAQTANCHPATLALVTTQGYTNIELAQRALQGF